MRNASIEHGPYVMKEVFKEVEFMFKAMMRGENMTSQLQSYLPIKMETLNYPTLYRGEWVMGRRLLDYNYPKWRESFKNILRPDESIRGSTKYRTKMMKTESNLISFNLSASSME